MVSKKISRIETKFMNKQANQAIFTHWKQQPVQEIFPGIQVSSMWQGKTKGKAVMVTIEAGSK